MPVPATLLILVPVTLQQAKQQYHVPASTLNSNLSEVSSGWGLGINDGYINANMILACSRGPRGAGIVWTLTLTWTLTCPPHRSLSAACPFLGFFRFSFALLTYFVSFLKVKTLLFSFTYYPCFPFSVQWWGERWRWVTFCCGFLAVWWQPVLSPVHSDSH